VTKINGKLDIQFETLQAVYEKERKETQAVIAALAAQITDLLAQLKVPPPQGSRMLAHAQSKLAPHICGCQDKEEKGAPEKTEARDRCLNCTYNGEWHFEPFAWPYSEKENEEDIEAFYELPQTLTEDAAEFWKADWKTQDPDTLATVDVAELLDAQILKVVPRTEYLLEEVEQTDVSRLLSSQTSAQIPGQTSKLYQHWVELGRPYPVSADDFAEWL
jgi:hypothetical protein